MPPVANRRTDVEIPLALWSAWTPSGGAPRQLRRPLTGDERRDLELRWAELNPILAPYGEREINRVTLALTDMFGGFPSLRQQSDEAIVGRVDAARRLLAGFPCWAIEKAARYTHMNGVWRDGKFDKQWAPSDAEIVAAVREALRLYSDSHRSAAALLSADVEERDPR